jgi:hypothetical protein
MEKGDGDNWEALLVMSKVSSFKAMGAASSERSDTVECGTLDGLGISKSSGGKSESPSDPEKLSGVTGCGVLPGALSMSCGKGFWSLCFT